MKVKKVLILIAAGFLFMWAPSLWAQVPPSFETTPVITEVEARRFVDEYVHEYVKMNLDAFMGFFSTKAIENRMLTYGDIRDIYRMTFENSESLAYDLKIWTVQIYREGASVAGYYEIVQALKGTPLKKVYKGNIQWDLIREDGVLRIKEINYGRDYRWDRPWHPYP